MAFAPPPEHPRRYVWCPPGGPSRASGCRPSWASLVAFERPSGPSRRRTWYPRESLAMSPTQPSWASWWPSCALWDLPEGMPGALRGRAAPLAIGPCEPLSGLRAPFETFPKACLVPSRAPRRTSGPRPSGGPSYDLRRVVGAGGPPLRHFSILIIRS